MKGTSTIARRKNRTIVETVRTKLAGGEVTLVTSVFGDKAAVNPLGFDRVLTINEFDELVGGAPVEA